MDQRTEAHLRRLIYRLMSEALIEMRTVAYEGRGHKGIFKIADLFHNVPLSLEILDREGGSYAELFATMTVRAERNGSKPWLDRAMMRIEHSMQASSGSDA